MDVDRPDVVAEVTEVFHRYEAALLANDLAVLDELFWDDPRVVRVGFDGTQHGFAAVAADRRARPVQTPPRTLRSVTVTAFGADVAVVATEFVPDGSDAIGRQSQTWVRFPAGWKVAGAHVSWQQR